MKFSIYLIIVLFLFTAGDLRKTMAADISNEPIRFSTSPWVVHEKYEISEIMEAAMEGVVSSYYEQYPFLNSKSNKANWRAIAEVVSARDKNLDKNNDGISAMHMAIREVAPKYIPH